MSIERLKSLMSLPPQPRQVLHLSKTQMHAKIDVEYNAHKDPTPITDLNTQGVLNMFRKDLNHLRQL